MLTVEYVRSVLDYDAYTGDLIWRYRPTAGGSFNTRFAGTVAGCVNQYGYIVLTLRGRTHFAHRVAWLHYYGAAPGGDLLDHIDRDRTNNAIANLREATFKENRRNTEARYVHELSSGSWVLSYTFDTKEDALRALRYSQKLRTDEGEKDAI